MSLLHPVVPNPFSRARSPRPHAARLPAAALPAFFRAAALAAMALSLLGPPAASAREYYGRPLYWIGLPGRLFCTQVTPEGNVNNGHLELAFFSGLDMRPLDGLEFTAAPDGRPRLHGRLEREGLRYDLDYLAAPLALGVFNPPEASVVRVRISNRDSHPRIARFWAGLLPADRPGRVHLEQTLYFFSWRCEFRRNVAVMFNDVAAVYPLGYAERLQYPGHSYYGRFSPRARDTNSSNPVLVARYEYRLAPGADTSLTFLFPGEPSPSSYGALLNRLGADTLTARFEALWDGYLSGMPRLQMGDARLTDFVRHSVASSLMQEGNAGPVSVLYANKDLRPSVEVLDAVPLLTLWQRLGLESWARRGYEGAQLMSHSFEVFSGRDGWAPTAAVVGLESQLSAEARGWGFRNSEDTLRSRADSVAAWTLRAGGGPQAPLELATAAWGLGRLAGLQAAQGRTAEAELRRRQARVAADAALARLLALDDSMFLSRAEPAVAWLERADAVAGGLRSGALRPGARARWRLEDGCVGLAGGDSVLVGPTLDHAALLPAGSAEATQSLLAIAAHADAQGGLPAAFNPRTRRFGEALPPEGVLGARLVEALLDRVLDDSAEVWMVGRGLPAPAAGESLDVGPLHTSLGPLRVMAVFRAAGADWRWETGGGASPPAGARVRIYAPPGARIVSGSGRIAADSSYAETDASAGRATLGWRPAPHARTLSQLMAEEEPLSQAPAAAASRASKRGSPAARPPSAARPGGAHKRR